MTDEEIERMEAFAREFHALCVKHHVRLTPGGWDTDGTLEVSWIPEGRELIKSGHQIELSFQAEVPEHHLEPLPPPIVDSTHFAYVGPKR